MLMLCCYFLCCCATLNRLIVESLTFAFYRTGRTNRASLLLSLTRNYLLSPLSTLLYIRSLSLSNFCASRVQRLVYLTMPRRRQKY